jgi:DNA-binding NtrC family response regulator
MTEMPLVLLVSSRTDWSSGLKSMLERSGWAVCRADNTAEAALLIHSYSPPHLVFTDMQLPDGPWTGILSLAETSPLPVNVIVVSKVTDIDVYVRALELGAFDFVVPPLEERDIDHVIRNAVASVEFRRKAARAKLDREANGRSAVGESEDDFVLRNEGFHIASLSS